VTTFLGRALVERSRVRQNAAVERAGWRATGALELAKYVILASPETAAGNQAIADALASNPPLIAGTPVVCEAAGPPRWVRLSALGTCAGAESLAQCLVRDGTSYVAYDYYVEGDRLGVSGGAKGRIHANGNLELHDAGGVYTGFVAAGNGFTFMNGAKPANTSFLGGADQGARPKRLLADVDFAALAAQATTTTPAGFDARITLNRTTVQIELGSPSTTVAAPTTGEVASNGVLYVPGAITSLKGELNGRLTIVTPSTVTITGNLRYVDGNGRYACRNGVTPASGDYVPDPAFVRNHALAVIAQGDITFDLRDPADGTGVPNDFELNGALISTRGRVGISGVEVDGSGTVSVTGDSFRLDSIRRLGTIMSARRPVSAVLQPDGSLRHGFRSGASIWDAQLLADPPPACPTERHPSFLENVRFDPASNGAKGTLTFAAGVGAMATLKSMSALKAAIGATKFDWGCDGAKARPHVRDPTATGR